MKKTTITISFDDEKLSATRRYMSKKNTNFDEELAKFAQKLFEKYVPANVQEYIAERENDEKTGDVKKRGVDM
ncbi:MAG: hypothetical protein IKP68_10290 [Clostridia bacterium]|nr:hypothetical protein [Clostridia bacterium]